jgi:hypothetical protein
MTNFKSVNLSDNDLGKDAWGRPKTVQDNSLLHAMFTFNIPVSKWYERVNTVKTISFTNCASVNGALEVKAGATLNDVTNLRTFRHPRYEPNRGFIYSSASIFVNPTGLMRRDFGTATSQSGVFFRLKSGGTLVGVVRTTNTGVTTEDEVSLNTTGIDLSKGNVYDIQYQWRGVGNYKFFINLKEVGNSNYLGTLDRLSMSNPANPIFFESTNLGDNDAMIFGCVDVSSEGGGRNGKTYGSVGISNLEGQIAITGYNIPIVAIRSKTLIGALLNTRDTVALAAGAYSDNKAIFRIWATRDMTAITEGTQVWKPFGDGHLEYIEYNNPTAATAMTFDIAKASLIYANRVEQDAPFVTTALFDGITSIFLTPGEMFVFTMHRETGLAAVVGTTFEFGEEI